MLTEVNSAAVPARRAPPVASAGDPSQDNFPLKGVIGLIVALALCFSFLFTNPGVFNLINVILTITRNFVLAVPALGRSQIRVRRWRPLCCYLSLLFGSMYAVIAAIVVFALKLPRWDVVCMWIAFVLDVLAAVQLLVGGEVPRREVDEEMAMPRDDLRVPAAIGPAGDGE
jgi:hypothetical protein